MLDIRSATSAPIAVPAVVAAVAQAGRS